MSSIKTIMVAVDFSKYSLAAARYATKLARDLSAGLLFANVVNQRDIDAVQRVMTAYDAFHMDNFIKERLKTRHDELKELITTCDVDPASLRTEVRIGVPHQKLLEIIEDHKPDLLVMATKGRSDIMDVVLGSCARVMQRRCPIPVLTLRGE